MERHDDEFEIVADIGEDFDWSQIEDAGPDYALTPEVNEALDKALQDCMPVLHQFVVTAEDKMDSLNFEQISYMVYAMQALRNMARLNEWFGEPVENVAWVARNLFEIHLWVSFLREDPANLQKFDSYGLFQKKQVDCAMRSMMLYMGAKESQVKSEAEIEAKSKALADEHDLTWMNAEERRFAQTKQLARHFGPRMSQLHDALSAISSAYLHPSPFSVGLPEGNSQSYFMKSVLAGICVDLLKLLRKDFESISL